MLFEQTTEPLPIQLIMKFVSSWRIDLWTAAAIATSSVPIYYTLRYLWELIPEVTNTNKAKRAVFISGCDTGFGRLLALKCVRNGIPTYAGCLTKEGEENLIEESKDWSHGKLVTVLLDVTSDDSVKLAAELVEKHLDERNIQLWALVNNAGIFSVYGPDAWTTMDHYKLSMDVNLYGVIRCTHAFLHLLKQSKGRIIANSSVAGRLAVPGAAPYCCAKYGVEAYMDACRMELRPYGITCCILEPGRFRTNLTDAEQHRARVNKVWDQLNPDIRNEYGEEYKNQFIDAWNSQISNQATTRLDYVVDSYYHAIVAKFPRSRYRCGWDAIFMHIPVTFLPTEIIDAILRVYGAWRPIPAAILAQKKRL
ncbi:short chain dehydrogenase domain-containing protein [Ditylenchus destructor]|uniref:Short chain dehydrogenase domain-containing protein n=1 Tax=Ditylenchus destructor TaxID=166010 RepID=A0AAD4N4E2_9BILA|nr:short chain dehydrogenase domain-containing protein [Ditylenchus destructor]